MIATATPAEAVVRLNAEIVRALNLAEERELLKSQSMQPCFHAGRIRDAAAH